MFNVVRVNPDRLVFFVCMFGAFVLVVVNATH